MWLKFGHEFVQEYFFNVHVRRLFEAEHQKSNTWYFYPGTIIGGTFPWVFFLLAAIYDSGKKIWQKQRAEKSLLFLLAWVIGILVFIQPAHSKLASYVFPVFPAIAIFIALFLERNLGVDSPQAKLIKGAGYALGGVFILVAIVGLMVSRKYIAYLGSLVPIYFMAAAASLLGVLMILCYRQRKWVLAFSTIPIFLLAFIATLSLAKPYAEPWVSSRQISDMLLKIDSSNTPILASKFYVRGVRFFTQRDMAVMDINGKGFFSQHPIPFLNTDEKVLSFLSRQARTFCVVKERDVILLRRIAAKGKYALTHHGNLGGRFIVSLERTTGF